MTMREGSVIRRAAAARGEASDVDSGLRGRLEARREEIHKAVLTRVFSVSDPAERRDSGYADGLREAVKASVDYGIAAIDPREARESLAPPESLMAQTRRAARDGVSLDTVLRRCFAGHALLVDFMIEEAESSTQLVCLDLKDPLRAQSVVFDRLLNALSEVYREEVESRRGTTEQRRAERVRGLLAGEPLSTSEFAYDFDVHHVGVVAKGTGVSGSLRDLAARLDCRVLAAPDGGESTWAWLGSRRGIDSADVERLAAELLPQEAILAIGEPAEGMAGWRLTHQQAKATMTVIARRGKRFARYVDVALFAAILHDDLLSASLRELYLEPLEASRDGGEALRDTLRAYFAAERNLSSAAAALRINRNTVRTRLQTVEELISRPIGDCVAELEAALKLHDVEADGSSTESGTSLKRPCA